MLEMLALCFLSTYSLHFPHHSQASKRQADVDHHSPAGWALRKVFSEFVAMGLTLCCKNGLSKWTDTEETCPYQTGKKVRRVDVPLPPCSLGKYNFPPCCPMKEAPKCHPCDVKNLMYHPAQGYLYFKNNQKSTARFSMKGTLHTVGFRLHYRRYFPGGQLLCASQSQIKIILAIFM